jgi:hypothetical protein
LLLVHFCFGLLVLFGSAKLKFAAKELDSLQLKTNLSFFGRSELNESKVAVSGDPGANDWFPGQDAANAFSRQAFNLFIN